MDDIALACRVLLGVVFVVSAASKLVGRQAFGSFVRSLRQMRVVPERAVRSVAALIVAVEVTIVVLLVTPASGPGLVAFTLAAGLLAVLTAAVVSVTVRGIDTTCRCFGKTSAPLGPQHVARNVFLLAVAVLGGVAELTGAPAEPGALLVAAAAGLVVGALVPMFDDLVDLFRSPTARRFE